MDPKTSSTVPLRCFDRAGAIEVLDETMRLLHRVPRAARELRALLDAWKDALSIDACLAELIDAIDPEIEPGGRLARTRLEAMRVATRARAATYRSLRETRKLSRG